MNDSIQFLVGRGGKNASEDVVVVQLLLNRIEPWVGGPRLLLEVDGIFGPKTLQAVRDFQAYHQGVVDGMLAPDGWTIRKLRSLAPQLAELNDGERFLTSRSKIRHA